MGANQGEEAGGGGTFSSLNFLILGGQMNAASQLMAHVLQTSADPKGEDEIIGSIPGRYEARV